MSDKYTKLRLERETIILFNEEEPNAKIYSASPAFHRKMERARFAPTKTLQQGDETSCWYDVPKKRVSVRQQPVLSPEKQEERRQLAKAMVAKRKKKDKQEGGSS